MINKVTSKQESNIFKLGYGRKHAVLPSYTPVSSLDILSGAICFGFGFWQLVLLGFFCYYYFPFELLSLLVIHLCKHCHYQPQCSQWLTLRYTHCSLQRANTSKCKGSDLSQLILYYGGKKRLFLQSCCRIIEQVTYEI